MGRSSGQNSGAGISITERLKQPTGAYAVASPNGVPMATHNVTTSIDLEPDELADLADTLACSTAQVPAKLAGFAQAALREYAEMMLGTGPIASATEMRERRLVHLIRHAYAGRIPDVHEISRVFNVPPNTATTMLRNAMSKHRRQIVAAVQSDIDDFKAGCQQQPDQNWRVAVSNPVLVEMLNARLEKAGAGKARITKDLKTLGEYNVPNGSKQWIDQNL